MRLSGMGPVWNEAEWDGCSVYYDGVSGVGRGGSVLRCGGAGWGQMGLYRLEWVEIGWNGWHRATWDCMGLDTAGRP